MDSKRCNHGNQFNRLTELPDSLLHHIMFYLQDNDNRPFRTIAIFGMSSKACYQAWLSYPYPHLSFVFEGNLKYIDRYLQWALDRGLALERIRINRSMKTPLERLSRWFNYLRALRVQVIDFRVAIEYHFTLPVSFFLGMNSLQELSLRKCFLKFDIELPSLKKLRLDHVKSWRYQTVEDVVKCFPSLEHLEIIFCSEFRHTWGKSIHISRLPNLKYVSIVDSYFAELNEVIIEAPRLREFSCSWQVCRPRFNAASWSSLRKLSLKARFGINNNVLHELLSYLRHLEHLSITSSMRNWKKPLISSTSIREIQLLCGNFKGVLHIDCPNLCMFSYHGSYTPHIDEGSTFSLDCKLLVYLNKQGYQYQHKDHLFDELKKFFIGNKIATVSCLELDISNKYWMDQHNELKEHKVFAPSQPPVQLKCMKLELRRFMIFPYSLLYMLLVVCRPEFIIFTFREMNNKDHGIVLALVKKVTTRFMMRSWQRSLKDAKLISLGTSEGKDKEDNFRVLNLDAEADQMIEEMGPLNLRAGFKLVWG